MKKSVKILYIANALPYDEINHAGGKTFNYYFKRLLKEENVDLTVIGICKEEEINKIDNEDYGYKCIPVITKGRILRNIIRVSYDAFGKLFRKESYGQSYYKTNRILKYARKLKNEGYRPDVIFLEWTNCVMMIDGVKNIFPEAKYVASEYDVSFLAVERKMLRATGMEKKRLEQYYKKFKYEEIEAIKKCDYSLPESEKDRLLLVNEGVDPNKVGVLVPYYHNMEYVNRERINQDILFWGAMYRPENYEAAIWFIENVMPLLDDTDVRFIAAGNKPPAILQRMASDRVIVTGFVKDEKPLFSESLCLVSPLLTGAGIKVKIIEALSAGIPTLTNDIGIEGIPAKDGESFFYCTKPEDYEIVIRKLMNNKIDVDSLQKKQKELIKKEFDLEGSYTQYKQMIISLLD